MVQFYLQRSSTLKRCKFVANVWYVKNVLANCDRNMYLPILHLPRVELRCKLQEKLHPVTRAFTQITVACVLIYHE